MPDIAWSEVLSDQPASAWATDFEQHVIQGSVKAGEVVFFHKPTRTLIVTDMVFNIQEPRNLLQGLIFRVFGTYKPEHRL